MKVEINNLTYIFLLLSFLSGYFEYVFLLLLIIFIHESGHYIFSCIEGIKPSKIIIYPFGGNTLLETELNTKIYKEFISLIGGIIFQLLFYLLVIILFNNNLITFHVFNIIKKINILLVSFNFLPIIPLDGGRLLNLFLDYFFCYKLSFKISIIISTIFTIAFGIINKTLFAGILVLFLIKSIYLEIINIDTKYNVFLFERYKNKYKFNKTIYINKYTNFKRDKYHIINNVNEDVFLSKILS